MKTIVRAALFAIALFLIFLISWDFIAPGLNTALLTEFKGISNSPEHLKILGFFRPANLSFPKMFEVGIISLLFSSLIGLLVSFGKQRNKKNNVFISAFIAGDVIASFFHIKYLVVLSKIMTPSGATPILRNPGLRYFVGTLILITIASLLILVVALGLRKALKNPLAFFVVVVALFVFSKLAIGIPSVQKITSPVIRESSSVLEQIVSPVQAQSLSVLPGKIT